MSLKKSLKDVIVLFVICAVFGTVLALVNSVTAPIIADRLAGAANEAYNAVIPGAKGFEDVDLSAYTLPSTVKEAKRETSGLGYGIKLETKGYGPGMVLIIGVSADGVVTGATCVTSSETNGDEKTYGANFTGKDMEGVSSVDLVAGSTMTTTAYKNAVIDAINTVAIFGGASVDTRTEEEILADNLLTALPAGEGEFVKHFMTDYTEGVTKLYEAKNGQGYVCVIGEGENAVFVGIDTEGNATGVVDALTNNLTEGTDEYIATAKAAVTAATNSTLEDIDITEYVNSSDRNVKKVFRSVLSAKKTATGNYVFELKATGYGSDPIVLLVSVSADGKIIDINTVSNSETPNIGGVQLEDGKFNAGFIGKTEEEANGVDTVTGVTVTTSAFKKAVINAFDAMQIIEGGATNE